MTVLPHLELAELNSPFDEALILIDGHEEETIRLECTGARELAAVLVDLVNNREAVMTALKAAGLALRSYEYGNAATDLAHDVATLCEMITSKQGAAA